MNEKFITAQEFDKKFDEGEEMTDYLDLANAQRPDMQIKRVSVDFPAWMVNKLDHEANLLGITRQSVIKFWISERLR
ncbi:MAG TPA: hypothetical protein PLW67_09965 [Prolixibacteraceae bacterium]|nr:hypothetical protein [Prolixibacteraceae bacterium]